jgi:hypothetical protein
LITITALLLTAFLFGGMLLYSFGFAAFLFTTLTAEQAGHLLREAFPHFYAWCVLTSLAAALPFYYVDPLSAGLLVAVAVTTIPARQALMPAINRATDSGNKSRFNVLHSASVVLTLLQIGAVGYCLTRLI